MKNWLLVNSYMKPVYCVELKRTFNSAIEAQCLLGIWATHITACCEGRRGTTGGYHWRYADAKKKIS